MMNDAQLYCSVRDVMESVKIHGDEGDLMRYIRSASQWLQQNLGVFLPVLEDRTIQPSGLEYIRTGPALQILSVKEYGATISDYEKDPSEGTWRNGPSTYLNRNNGACWNQKIVVRAWWGLYQEIRSLGINTSQLVGDGTLTVNRGGILSPGMVVGIDAEAELVTAGDGGPGSPAATVATSKLNGAMAANDYQMTVDNGAEFFEGEIVSIGTEDLRLNKRSGNVWAVDRSWNGTTLSDHPDDSAIGIYRTYSVNRSVNGSTAAGHTAAAIGRYMVPDDLLYLAVQMVVLMREKAGTMFGGRAGSSEAGETFFVNEFPSQQIEKIKANYRAI